MRGSSAAQQCATTGAVVGGYAGATIATSMVAADVVVGAKVGGMAGSVAGPAGAVVGAAAGAAAGVAVYVVAKGIGWLFSGSNRSPPRYTPSPPPSPKPRIVRKASVEYQRSQQQGSSGQSGGSGQDPNWWNNILKNEEGLSPLEIFQRIVQEILIRLKGASKSERLALLKKLREALANLLKRYPKIKIEIEEGTRNLVVDLPDDAIDIKAEFVDALEVFNEDTLELGIDRDVDQPCVYRIRCRDCGTNYVGQSVSPRQRVRNHRKDMKAKDTSKSIYQHHKTHRCVYGCTCDFEETYDFVILMVLEEGSTYTELRPAEVFWQWLMKALEDDEGIGKK